MEGRGRRDYSPGMLGGNSLKLLATGKGRFEPDLLKTYEGKFALI